MIITLSPAKILDFESTIPIISSSQPIFEKEANELNSLLKKLSLEDLATLLKVNPPLAQNAYEYIHSFDLPQAQQRQAVLAYNGIAYQGLDATSFTTDDFEYAQKQLVLMSGMYGMLRPLDMIKPHRLDMEIKLENRKRKNLYDFWKEKITKQMTELLNQNSNSWINLASKEYEKAVDKKKLPKGFQIITPVFKEARGKDFRQVVVYSKKARGMMARFIVQNKLDDLEHLKAFDTEGYSYSEQLSTKNEWTFIR